MKNPFPNIFNALASAKPKTTSTPISVANKSAEYVRLTKVQFERIRVDVKFWRDSAKEAELAYFPFRVKMQMIFQDTILNEHVEACLGRRKNLTLLRKFKICDDAGNENEELTKLFKKPWFRLFQSFVLDALFFGYNLIELGDIINDSFPNISFVRRQNVSPDRKVASSFAYMPSGDKFQEAPFEDWYIYVATPTETASSKCGFGLLYKVARAEIFLRNNVAQNADYNEVFGQPLRKGTTTKTGEQRNAFEQALRDMGAMPYILTDDGQDTVELISDSNAGRGFMTYSDFEKRNEQKISKILLGHADAMDSVPGKIGASQGESSPVITAMLDKQSEDAEFIQPFINEELIPRMIRLGFNIPLGLHFEYLNDDEAEAFRAREDDSNQKTAVIMKTIKDAGGDMSDKTWKYFEDRTGIPGVTKALAPPPPIVTNPINGDPNADEVKQKKIAALKDQMNKSTNGQRQKIQAEIDKIIKQ